MKLFLSLFLFSFSVMAGGTIPFLFHPMIIPTSTCGGGNVGFVASSTATGLDSAVITVSVPAGTVNGHVMIAAIYHHDAGTLTAPAGWTLIRDDGRQKIYYRVANSEPASYTWSLDVSFTFSAAILTYSGVSTVTPIDTHSGSTTTATSITAPTVTAACANSVLVGLFGQNNDGAITLPGALTQRAQIAYGGAGPAGNKTNLIIGDRTLASAGATGDSVATGVSALNTGQHLVLSPREAPQFRSVATTINTSGTNSITVNVPAGVQNNDLLIAVITMNYTTANGINTPAGWTLLTNTAASNVQTSIFWRLASSEPASYSWTMVTSKKNLGMIFAYQNLNLTAPYDAGAGQANATSTNIVAPSISPTGSNDLLLAIYSCYVNSNPATWTLPGGQVSRGSLVTAYGSADIATIVGEEYLTASGATGTRTATLPNSCVSVGILNAFKR